MNLIANKDTPREILDFIKKEFFTEKPASKSLGKICQSCTSESFAGSLNEKDAMDIVLRIMQSELRKNNVCSYNLQKWIKDAKKKDKSLMSFLLVYSFCSFYKPDAQLNKDIECCRYIYKSNTAKHSFSEKENLLNKMKEYDFHHKIDSISKNIKNLISPIIFFSNKSQCFNEIKVDKESMLNNEYLATKEYFDIYAGLNNNLYAAHHVKDKIIATSDFINFICNFHLKIKPTAKQENIGIDQINSAIMGFKNNSNYEFLEIVRKLGSRENDELISNYAMLTVRNMINCIYDIEHNSKTDIVNQKRLKWFFSSFIDNNAVSYKIKEGNIKQSKRFKNFKAFEDCLFGQKTTIDDFVFLIIKCTEYFAKMTSEKKEIAKKISNNKLNGFMDTLHNEKLGAEKQTLMMLPVILNESLIQSFVKLKKI